MNEINISVRDKISLKDAVKIAQRFCPEFDKKLIEYEVNETYEGLLETEDKLLKFGMDTSDIPITMAQVSSMGFCSLMELHEKADGFEEQASTYIALEFWTILAERLGRYVRYNNMPVSTQGEKK